MWGPRTLNADDDDDELLIRSNVYWVTAKALHQTIIGELFSCTVIGRRLSEV